MAKFLSSKQQSPSELAKTNFFFFKYLVFRKFSMFCQTCDVCFGTLYSICVCLAKQDPIRALLCFHCLQLCGHQFCCLQQLSNVTLDPNSPSQHFLVLTRPTIYKCDQNQRSKIKMRKRMKIIFFYEDEEQYHYFIHYVKKYQRKMTYISSCFHVSGLPRLYFFSRGEATLHLN